jgi:DNA-binding transcriptional MerR regulator
LIKIGDFARLCRVSVATLHHYDDMGLLKPITVDAFTGYRYYSVAQMPRLNRILALKDLGFSLEQIDQVLSGGLSLEQLRGMLKLKQAEVEQHVSEEQDRLRRITTRLRQIELEDAMPNYEVVLKTIAPMLIASRTVTIPTNDQVPKYLNPAFCAAHDYAAEQGAKFTGPCFAIWHQAAAVHENEVAEAAYPIDRPLPGNDEVNVYELPQAQVAAAVHHGEFENFVQLHTVLLKWIEANGYRVAGAYREFYLEHDPKHMDESATEIQYPVEKL